MLNALFHGIQGPLRQEGRGDAEVNDALLEGSAGDHANRTESYVGFQAGLPTKFCVRSQGPYAIYSVCIQCYSYFGLFKHGVLHM
jgi:hypothetical protein